MAITGFPWFKVYAAETLSDENFLSWTLAERGAWFTLLCHCWKEGSIPADIEKLARLCGCDARAMPEHWSSIAHRFLPHENPSRLVSARLELERQNSLKQSMAKSEHARTGANARWAKEKKDMPEQCPSNARAMPNDAPQSQSQTKEKKRSPEKRSSKQEAPLKLETDPRKILQPYGEPIAKAFWELSKTWPRKTQRTGDACRAYLQAINESDPVVIQQAAELVARSKDAQYCIALDKWLQQAGWLVYTGGE